MWIHCRVVELLRAALDRQQAVAQAGVDVLVANARAENRRSQGLDLVGEELGESLQTFVNRVVRAVESSHLGEVLAHVSRSGSGLGDTPGSAFRVQVVGENGVDT